MKRDMDLMRGILIEIENSDDDPLGWLEISIDGFSEMEVSYQIKLLDEAGLIHAQDLSSTDGMDFRAKSLTWQGHEFLDNAKDENVWKDAKRMIGEKIESVSFTVLSAILVETVKRQIGLG